MNRPAFKACACAAALSITACSGGTSAPLSRGAGAFFDSGSGSGSSPISHVVVIVQENRTFNDLFAQFPGATGTTVGEKHVGQGKKLKDEPVYLQEVHLTTKTDLNHSYPAFLTAYNNGKMDGFNQVRFLTRNNTEDELPYQYVYPTDVGPYWTMAEQYDLANAMFTTQGSSSYTAHQDLLRGGTAISSTASLIDNPAKARSKGYAVGWGCDSPSKTRTSLITTSLQFEHAGGPFPCTANFPDYGYGYATLRDLMDAQSPAVTWKYYTPPFEKGTGGAIWNAFDTIAAVRNDPYEWGVNVNWPETNIFNDITNGALPAVSWVIPDSQNSDHPGNGTDTGPSWVAGVVNAIGESPYWNSTAIIIVWDDWGGFYDPVAPPPRDNQGGPGLRVPMIVVSPYATIGQGSQGGYVSNVTYEFGSIIRFIEDTFNLGRLGTTDVTTNSIGPESYSYGYGGDMLNFEQSPRSFTAIPSKYPRAYFLHQKPGRAPVDSQ